MTVFSTPHDVQTPVQTLAQDIRPDVWAKLSGNPGYLTDRIENNQLHGLILGSPHPHARIVRIDTHAAEQLPGVHAVVTHADIPGIDRYGLRKVDRPILCHDKVRYVGDPVAAIAAIDLQTAYAALELIHVEYEQLPLVDDPEAALADTMLPDAQVHAGGNLLHAVHHQRGDMQAAQSNSVYVLEASYTTPRQMHAFLETEGGVAQPDGQGGLQLFFGGHNPVRESQVIANMLGLPHKRVTALGTPVGGSYGGKDELTIQPIAALLAWKCQRAVRLHLSRPQSVDFGVKRHPMRIRLRMGCDAQGRLTFQQARVVADTGAYATHGPEVLDAAVEHMPGPYAYQAVDIQARLAYTNNGVAGAFRGFGAVQVQFALEQHMDRLAAMASIPADTFRAMNLTAPDAPGPLDQTVVPFDGQHRALDVASQHALWQGPHYWTSQAGRYQHGVGLALVHRSDGFGKGGPSGCRMALALAADGSIELRSSFTELGQNLIGSIRNLCAQHLGCAPHLVRPVLGDTRYTPDSGPVAASRATSLVWRALIEAKDQWLHELLNAAAQYWQLPSSDLTVTPEGVRNATSELLPYVQIAEYLGTASPCIAIDLHAEDPADNAHDTHFVFGACAALAQVRVDTWSGMLQVEKMVICSALGPTVSAQGYVGQMEGGAVMGLGMCVSEELECVQGHYVQRNLDAYFVPSIADAPDMEVLAIQNLPEGDPIGPRGAGEISVNVAAPAVANAIARALQRPVERLPMLPHHVITALESTP